MTSPKDKGKGKAPATPASSDVQSGTAVPGDLGVPYVPHLNDFKIPTRREWFKKRSKQLWGSLATKLSGKKAADSSPKIDDESDESDDDYFKVFKYHNGGGLKNIPRPPETISDRLGDENEEGSENPDDPNHNISLRSGEGSKGSKTGESSKESKIAEPLKGSKTTQSQTFDAQVNISTSKDSGVHIVERGPCARCGPCRECCLSTETQSRPEK
jgi:hypothetical protein